MEKVVSSFTVFFEGPYWVGVYERLSRGRLEAGKITFGPEPKDYTIYEYLQKHENELKFSPPVSAGETSKEIGARINPKRLQRQIGRQLMNPGVGTKAQQALALQHEEGKQLRKERSREEKEQEKERIYDLKREKRKQKHRGR